MITEQDVRKALHKVVKSEDVWAWDPAFDFREEALDSLDHATFALYLDERWSLKVTDAELAELRSIRAVMDFVQRKQPAK